MSLDIWQERPLRAKNACGRCSGKGGIQVRFASGAHYKTTCPCCNGTGQRKRGYNEPHNP
jgi:DnaJ-class molecular chaperone